MNNFYHGSRTAGISELQIEKTKSGRIFVTTSRLTALIYAIKKFPNMFYQKNGKELFLEIKPGLLEKMFAGREAFIYEVENKDYVRMPTSKFHSRDNCYNTDENVKIVSCEKIEDAAKELNKYIESGELVVKHYEEFTKEELDRIYADIEGALPYAKNREDYNEFLKL